MTAKSRCRRGYHGFDQAEAASVLRRLLSLAHVTVEDGSTVEQAISHWEAGIGFADALHYASYRHCASMATFDDRKFARRARKLGVSPTVVLLA